MPLSGTTNYAVTRDQVIARALRIVGAIATGEIPTSNALAEAADALNQLIKEWQADGMQLWGIITANFPMTAGVPNYPIGLGATINQQAPNKVYQAWMRTTATTFDQPMILLTRQEYDILSSKLSPSGPSQFYYQPPGNLGAGQMIGTFYIYPCPDAFTAANKVFYFTGQFPLNDLNLGTDTPDFPSYYYNALTWGLADQLGFEYGVPIQAQSQITNKAAAHLEKALSFDREEGSLFVQPDWQSWQSQG